ncbi:hypothetical protein, partial [Pseudomonas amygdali]|uniref:hypothetical protein n=1 Tax=Pseudomonas amygdali TaxID=47877 RepID=UPI001C7EE8BF
TNRQQQQMTDDAFPHCGVSKGYPLWHGRCFQKGEALFVNNRQRACFSKSKGVVDSETGQVQVSSRTKAGHYRS